MTINLEKALIAQNKKINTPKELLFLKEYDRLEEIAEDESLSRIGLNKALSEGKEIKARAKFIEQILSGYNKDRVFHISQIETLCKKYHLRFLRADKFKGSIDKEIPAKINQFEIAYSVKCDKWKSYIAAPKESFELQERPKDPLLFYQITGDYFYLIHKWGKDVSVFRRVLGLLSSKYIIAGIYIFLSVWFLSIVRIVGAKSVGDYFFCYLLITIIIGCFYALLCFAFNFFFNSDNDVSAFPRIINNDNWNSEYR